MTSPEQMIFCSICMHREANLKAGLLCGLTHNDPDFEKICPDFEKDDREATKKLARKMDAAGSIQTTRGLKPLQNKIMGTGITLLGLGVFILSIFVGGVIIVTGILQIIKGFRQEKVLRDHERFMNRIAIQQIDNQDSNEYTKIN